MFECKEEAEPRDEEVATLDDIFQEVQQNKTEFKDSDPVYANAISCRNNVNIYCNKFMADGLPAVAFICGKVSYQYVLFFRQSLNIDQIGGPSIYMGPYFRGVLSRPYIS